MTSLTTQLMRMSRPSMLVRAARVGAASTLRHRARSVPSNRQPYQKLIDEEARLDEARRAGDAGYSPTRHVEVLAHLLAEAGYGALPSG